MAPRDGDVDDGERDAVQNVTPAAISCPTVGVNYRGVDICLSIDLLGVGATDTAGGIYRRDWAQTCKLTHDVPRFGALVRR